MSLYDDFQETDKIDDISFIAGSEVTLKFPCHDEYGNAISVNGATCHWALALYGQPDQTILEKDATISDTDTFSIALAKADTLDLGGVYMQQAEITDSAGKHFIPAQGIVVIRKAIKMS